MDYKEGWKNFCEVINNKEDFIMTILGIQQSVRTRNENLRCTPYTNIDEYNRYKTDNEKWKRIVLVIEEAADILIPEKEIKNLSKEEQKLYYNMLEILVEIGRKGASAGCHIFLNTQRPDASIIPAQLNSNFIGGCIAGRSNSILSNIILGNDDADVLIPKKSQGLFVTDSHELFQSYLLDLSEIERNDNAEHQNSCNSYSKSE